MQLATVRDGKPWICTVHYVADAAGNLYWLSLPKRRHSQDITDNPHVAVAVAVKTDMPVIGIQTEGMVTMVDDPVVVKNVMDIYVAVHGNGKDYYQNFIQGTEQHRLYKFTPERTTLFDEVHFKDAPQVILGQVGRA
ncbi:MAG: hypothetical protein JWP13_170 [Candidatus Saccharibacteria bacterium]|nr:hypothetical protein [Candidatus Saccharibacteria bacterium]